MAAAEPLVLIVDAHALITSSLAAALRHAGFARVATVDRRELELDAGDQPSPNRPVAGDLELVGLLYGDGRTATGLIEELAGWGCRVLVTASDHGLRLTGDCLHRGAETVVDLAISFERLVEALRRLSAGGQAYSQRDHVRARGLSTSRTGSQPLGR